MDFGLRAPTRLVFSTLVSRCWWTLTFALSLVFSFSVKVHQQRLTSVKKDKTIGSAQAKVHRQRLTNVKKDKTNGSAQVKVHQQRLAVVSSQSKSQSPPTAADQFQKDKTSGSAQAKVHQQRLTSVKKRLDEWKRTSQSPPTATFKT